MDFLVVGTGGNGQTYFMQYLIEKSFRINRIYDEDKMKHLSCPSKLSDKHKELKIIYVYNKTFDSICSHYRRKWPIIQMNKIKNHNDCNFSRVEEFFEFTERSLSDHFGCKDHFLRWYKYTYKNGIYFLNLNELNKGELSKYMNCDSSIFDKLNFDSSKRNKYDNLKNRYPQSNIMYKNIDNYIHDLCVYRNKKLFSIST